MFTYFRKTWQTKNPNFATPEGRPTDGVSQREHPPFGPQLAAGPSTGRPGSPSAPPAIRRPLGCCLQGIHAKMTGCFVTTLPPPTLDTLVPAGTETSQSPVLLYPEPVFRIRIRWVPYGTGIGWSGSGFGFGYLLFITKNRRKKFEAQRQASSPPDKTQLFKL